MRRLILVTVIGVWAGCASSVPPDSLPPGGQGSAVDVTGVMPQSLSKLDPVELIEAGDTLEVIVQRGAGEEKYATYVRANGIITVAFVDIDVKGLTEAEAEARITEQLMPVIRNPRVSVRLTQKGVTRTMNFYIFGEVKGPGKYPLGRRATLLQALGQGGGNTEVADLEKVLVISRRGDTPQIRVANVQSVLERGELSANLALDDEDVIFVPRNGIGDFNLYYTKVVQPILTTAIGVVNAIFIGKALEVLFRTPVPTSGVAVAVPCWVASVLYGEHAWQTHLLRWYISGPLSKQTVGRLFLDLYIRYGQQVARFLKRYPSTQVVIKPLFDRLLQRALVSVDDTRPVSQTRMQRSIRPFLQTG